MATYVTDDPQHPCAAYPETSAPLAVYCDVLVYPSIGGQRWFGLPNVLVAQDIAGMHRGRIWKPRAANIDITGNLTSSSNPAHMDGDHVLVGFMNDSLDQPVIIKSLPHPGVDTGREDLELGQRMKLTLADGDPDFIRHHGVHYGVTDVGDFLVDTTFANPGKLEDDGKEQPPPTDGTGSQTHKLPLDAKYEVVFFDMADPTAPEEKLRFTILKDSGELVIKDAAGKFHISVEDGETLTIEKKNADAKLVLGDGAVKAAIADHLETLWGQLKSWLEEITVPTGVGPSGKPLNVPATAWDAAINSQKLTFPDN